MRFERSDRFVADYKRLGAHERELFKAAVRELNEAYGQRGARLLPEWPAHLRVKSVQGATGIFEMTWSFSGPDGRATFELIDADGQPAIRWRRIGGHEVFRRP